MTNYNMTKNWIPHPTILKGSTVELLPFEKEHFEDLYSAASDKELWNYTPTDGWKKKVFYELYSIALTERDTGRQYPFVIFHKEKQKLIGSTRLFEIYPADKKIEIGWTWIEKEFWGTTVNLECKLLLMTYCFEVLKVNRVQLKTKDTNFRSRKAIEKIGGVFEGILRKDKVQSDGTSRNSAYYSILDDEWQSAKEKIEKQIIERLR